MQHTMKFPLSCLGIKNLPRSLESPRLMFRLGFNDIVKLILQLWLLGLFMRYFGLPALERYHNKEVIVVTSKRESEGIPVPAVTIAVQKNDTKNGWKDTEIKWGFVKRLCSSGNTAEAITDCIEKQTYNLSEIVTGVDLGFWRFSNKVEDVNWKEDFAHSYAGRTYTLELSLKLRVVGLQEEDQSDIAYYNKRSRNILNIGLQENLSYELFIHDPKYFYVTTNVDTGPLVWLKKTESCQKPACKLCINDIKMAEK